MAGIGLENVQPIRANAADFVGPDQSAVEQSAIAQLSDAFRKGLVNADDLIQRYGELAKTKEKAEIQGLHEFLSPEAIQSRKDAIAAEGGAARLKNAQITSAIGSVPLAQQATDAEITAKLAAAQLAPNRYDLKRDFILQLGGQVPDIDWTVGPTNEQKTELNDMYQKAVSYRMHTGMAQGFLGAMKAEDKTIKKTDSTGKEVTQVFPGANHVHPIYGQIDDATRQRIAGLAFTPFTEWMNHPKTFSGALTGEHYDQPLVEPKASSTPTEKPEVATPAAAPATAEPAGGYVAEEKVPPAPPLPQSEQLEKLKGQISASQEMLNKIQEARAIVHDTATTPVGPGITEGARVNQALTGAAALFGLRTAKYEQQRQLDQFIAANIQSTIKALAGTGNRVMQAEIDEHGLFKQASPKLTDTVKTWDDWFRHQEDVFKRAIADAQTTIPPSMRPAVATPTPTPAAPSGTGASAATPGAPIPITGGHAQFVGGKWIFFPGTP